MLVVGGYGQVGRRAARRLLADAHPVVIAGRSAARAAEVASELGCGHARIDLEDARTWGAAADGTATVLCCVDQTDVGFVRWVLRGGRDYVDITASDAFFRRVEELVVVAKQSASVAVLSVGLAPGLTNLLVKRLAAPLSTREEVLIAVRLGLGERHGALAVEWSLQRFAETARWSALAAVEYPGERAPTCALPIDIADQHVVRRTMGFARARTLMTLESSAWTRAVALLAPALRIEWIRRGVRCLFPYLHMGRDAWTLAVEVRGAADGRQRRSRLAVDGVNEAEGTAAVAELVVHQLAERRRPGVFHIEELFDLKEVLERVDATLRDPAGLGPLP